MTKNYGTEHEGNLLWIDLEMTGLDPSSDLILEMALAATSKELNILAESPTWVLSCPEAALQGMDEWNSRTHARSGLLDDVRSSRMSVEQVQDEALAFARAWATPRHSPMCGNTICQDRRFLAKWMPELEAFFHYRNFDVTSFKLAAVFYRPELVAHENKSSNHRAASDIRDSIDEMRLYRSKLLA